MSAIPVDYLVTDAAFKIGDPARQRVQNDQWASIYNSSTRALCEKANVLKVRDIFTPTTGQAYTYPPGMTSMTGMEVTDAPGDDDSWRVLDEMFEDEFRATTSMRYPSATLPTHYFATVNWFYLIPRPEVAIVGGGRITHFALPDRITDVTTATFQLEEMMQDYVIEHMVILAMQARNRWVEAKAELELWNARVEGLGDTMEDRSKDRRSSMAPRKNRYAGMR